MSELNYLNPAICDRIIQMYVSTDLEAKKMAVDLVDSLLKAHDPSHTAYLCVIQFQTGIFRAYGDLNYLKFLLVDYMLCRKKSIDEQQWNYALDKIGHIITRGSLVLDSIYWNGTSIKIARQWNREVKRLRSTMHTTSA